MSKTTDTFKLLPLFLGFFVMGFVDVVGISTSYVKADFNLNDATANLLPMSVFLWFAVCSLPVGALMNRIGRKRTVLLSSVVTVVAMLLPVISYTYPVVLVAFALLGIGNTILQVSLNPLLMDVVSSQRRTSMLTLGQFIKAISSTLGPVIAGFAAASLGNWKLLFPIYALITVLSFVWLWLTPVNEEKLATVTDRRGVLSLLAHPRLLMLLSGIVLIVGFEIGLMTVVPKYLHENFGYALDKAGLGCSLYYVARTTGALLGAIILAKMSSRKFMIRTLGVAVLALSLMLLVRNQTLIFGALFVLGLMGANVFAILFSEAMTVRPAQVNEISALMIMGVAGGALIPPIMGVVADFLGLYASMFVLLGALLYVFYLSFRLEKNN